jgi:hypothetical protein
VSARRATVARMSLLGPVLATARCLGFGTNAGH